MGTKIYIYISFLDEHAAFYGKKKPAELPPKPKRTNLGDLVPRVQNRLYVIGEKEEDIKDLPDLGLDLSFTDSSFCVAKSRLFFVGGKDSSEEEKINGILSLNLATEKDLTWEEIPVLYKDESYFDGRTAVIGDQIYAIHSQGTVYVFDLRNMAVKYHPANNLRNMAVKYHPANNLLREYGHCLAAFTNTKMYVNCLIMSYGTSSTPEYSSLFGYYDIPSLDWHVIHRKTTCLYFYRDPTVIIRDKYLIYYENYSPLEDFTYPFLKYKEKFHPGLYVYDIEGDKWLDEPVKNLPNDGILFPSLEGDYKSVVFPSVMQVSADELAFVWCTRYPTSALHVTRFRLDVDDDAGAPLTFKAENVRVDHFHVGIPIFQVKSASS